MTYSPASGCHCLFARHTKDLTKISTPKHSHSFLNQSYYPLSNKILTGHQNNRMLRTSEIPDNCSPTNSPPELKKHKRKCTNENVNVQVITYTSGRLQLHSHIDVTLTIVTPNGIASSLRLQKVTGDSHHDFDCRAYIYITQT